MKFISRIIDGQNQMIAINPWIVAVLIVTGVLFSVYGGLVHDIYYASVGWSFVAIDFTVSYLLGQTK